MSEYERHLRSQRWAAKRQAVLLRSGHVCEVPGCHNEARAVHHLTYDRFGDERLEDLAAVCPSCDGTLHDPAWKVSIRCLRPPEFDPNKWSGAEDEQAECGCPVCSYQKAARTAKLQLRERLSQQLNRSIRQSLLGPEDGSQMAGLKRAWTIGPVDFD